MVEVDDTAAADELDCLDDVCVGAQQWLAGVGEVMLGALGAEGLFEEPSQRGVLAGREVRGVQMHFAAEQVSEDGKHGAAKVLVGFGKPSQRSETRILGREALAADGCVRGVKRIVVAVS